jgi:hypothetical protein
MQVFILFVFIFSGSAAQRGLWPHRPRGFLITNNDAPHSVGILWTSDQLVAENSTWQHTQQTNIHVPGGIRTHDGSRRAAVHCAAAEIGINASNNYKFQVSCTYFTRYVKWSHSHFIPDIQDFHCMALCKPRIGLRLRGLTSTCLVDVICEVDTVTCVVLSKEEKYVTHEELVGAAECVAL